MERGLALHKAAEDFIKGDTDVIDAGIATFTDHLQHLRDKYTEGLVLVERNWGFDINWNPVDFDDPECWTRGSLDVLEHLSDTEACGEDWKSGKRYPPKHIQQEQLYVVYTAQVFPHLMDFRFRFRYFDERGTEDACSTERRYNRGNVERLKAGFHSRGIRMTTDTQFKPHPSPINCKWCDYNETCEWAAK